MEPINRKLLKENAKKALKRNFWVIMLVCFCTTFLNGNFNGLNAGGNASSGMSNAMSSFSQSMSSGMNYRNSYSYRDFNGNTFDFDSDDFKDEIDDIEDEFISDFQDEFDWFLDDLQADFDDSGWVVILWVIAIICIVILIVYALAITISFLIGSFLGAPISVGYRRFFMLNRLGKGKFTDIFAAFGKGRYMKIVKTMFKTNIEIFLWRLLFYFPGVVKLYQYYFVGFIMAENPNIDPKRAKELSKQMTDGHKWQIFVLQLSFIGWYMLWFLAMIVLTVFSCGLLFLPSILLAYPLVGYVMATYSELYEERREYALMTGMAKKEELIGFDFGA